MGDIPVRAATDVAAKVLSFAGDLESRHMRSSLVEEGGGESRQTGKTSGIVLRTTLAYQSKVYQRGPANRGCVEHWTVVKTGPLERREGEIELLAGRGRTRPIDRARPFRSLMTRSLPEPRVRRPCCRFRGTGR